MPSTDLKKIVFVAPSAYPLGGVQNWLDYLLPGLKRYEYSATLTLTSGKYHDAAKYLESHDVEHVMVLKNLTGTEQGRISAIEAMLLELRPEIVVVVNIIDVYQAVNNLRQTHNLEIRVITSLHGINQNFFAGIRANTKIIDAVVSTNRLTERLVNDSSGLEKSRSMYSPYGVELSDSIATDRAFESGKPPGLRLAYAGRFDEDQKRFADTLAIFSKALSDIDELSIIIAGAGPSLPSLEDWLEENPSLSTRIEYLGVIKPEEVNENVYQKSDILLLTSQWETGPIVAWEAMSQGVCFISSRYHGHIEEQSLIHEQNCLLFDVGDVDAAVEQIKYARDKTLRAKINKHALELVKQKYTHAKSIKTWVTCFDKALKLPARPFSKESIRVNDIGRATSIMYSTLGATGLKLLEKIRGFLKIQKEHLTAGSEWPHSYRNEHSESIARKLMIQIEKTK